MTAELRSLIHMIGGHRVIEACNLNNIPYKTSYPVDAPECTIWLRKGNLKKLRRILKK